MLNRCLLNDGLLMGGMGDVDEGTVDEEGRGTDASLNNSLPDMYIPTRRAERVSWAHISLPQAQ